MYPVQQVTADASQFQTLVLPDGSTIALTIQYKDIALGWFITNLTYGDLQIKGMRITTSPNMLHQFKNQLPFGLCCLTESGQEPTTQQDFISGRAKLFILTAAEVAQYGAFLSG